MSNEKTNRARTTVRNLLRLSVVCFIGLFFLLLLQTADASKTGMVSDNIVTSDGDAVITVTTTADDITPNDGSVSLREAITASNAGNDLGDPDITAQAPGTFGPLNTIKFNIPGGGVKTINVGTDASAANMGLPGIFKPVIINGYTQGVAHPNTQVNTDDAVILIELNGFGVSDGFNFGLNLVSGSGGSTIKGLAINRFRRDGVEIQTDSNSNRISGNFIGTNAAGSTAMGNFSGGVVTGGSDTIVGGPGVADRNIISGNGSIGVFILNPAMGNTVQGNFIGISASGASALGNVLDGVNITSFGNITNAANNVIKGNIIAGNGVGILLQFTNTTGNTIQSNRIGTNATATAALPNVFDGIEVGRGAHNNSILGNIISGNTGAGVSIFSSGTSGNVVAGNFIGTDVTGNFALGNTSGGVFIVDFASNNIIGNSSSGGNTIAFNGGPGVAVTDSGTIGNAIRQNSIFSNAGLGIDLGNDGVTPNDAGDADTGPNNLQNFPVLAAAASGSGGGTTVQGSLNSTANTNFLIDFYSTVALCGGQGQTYFGTIPVTTDAGGNATFTANFPTVNLPTGRHVTATATTAATFPAGDTSEFSPCVFVAAPLTATGTTINAVEGLPLTNVTVATFTSSNAALPASNFTATINWGDATALSSGTIVSNGGGSFTVKGSHTYAEEGSFNVTVTIHDIFNSFDATVNTAATVADAPLSVATLSAGTNQQFSGVGGNNASGGALTAFSAFKTAIGGVKNVAASPQNGGFRTINWDGVALTQTDGSFTNQVIFFNKIVGIPTNRFQEQGMNFDEVYAVSGDGFVSANPGVAGKFPAFSPNNTFAMFNDNIIDFNFVLPSNHATPPIQAVSSGFGAIFINVVTPNTTSIEYFSGTTSLGKFFVPTGTSGQAEFFGVLFQNPVVTNVEITLGNAILFSFDGVNVTSGPPDNPGGGTNLAVTDDFAYAEPTAVSTGININAVVGAPFSAKVASFTDADPSGQVSDYSVVIDWGDGTTSAGGVTPNSASEDTNPPDSMEVTITPSINGGFDVTGTHTYNTGGTFTITTSIRDVGGASISAKSTATVAGTAGGVLQFSAASYSVDEDNPRVDITVTRSGNTLGAASVGFATSDTAGLQNCNVFNGIASSRCDYETTIGTLQFAPGDTSKSFSVAIVNDSYAEGNETFTVSLSNVTGATLGTPATATVTIIDNDSTTGPNPIDSTDFFVRQHYLDLLGREPDPPGFGAWVSLINDCAPGNTSCDRVHVSEAFFESEEFQERGYFVYRFYSVSFGRKPSYAEFAPDLARVSGFLDVNQLEAAKVAFIADFMARSAFVTKYNSLNNTVYVDTLLSTAGVTLSASTRQAMIDGLNGGTLTRAQVLRQIVETAEVSQKYFNEAFVVMEYFGYLRRDPDALYLNWITFLNSGGSSRTMVSGFVNSLEYRQRFGP